MPDKPKGKDGLPLVRAADLAPMLNLSSRRVHQLVAEGIIPGPVTRGRYDLVASVSGYTRYLYDLAVGKGDDAHKAATTELAIERAKKAQRENMKAAGELIPKTEIVAMIQGMFGHCRARLLAIPTKLSPVVFLSETVPETKELLTDAIKEALEELSETRAVSISSDDDRTGRRARGNGSVAGMATAAGSNRQRVGRSKARPKSGKRRRAGKVADKPR